MHCRRFSGPRHQMVLFNFLTCFSRPTRVLPPRYTTSLYRPLDGPQDGELYSCITPHLNDFGLVVDDFRRSFFQR